MLALLGSDSLRGVRLLAGMAVLLAAIYQSATAITDPTRQAAVGALALVIVVGWLFQSGRWAIAGVWVLGLASCGLALVAEGSAPVIGVIAAIVNAGLRLPTHRGGVAALVLSALFLVAIGYGSHWSNLLGLAFTATGLAFAYVTTTSVRRIRLERERAESLLEELQRTRAAEIERAALAERSRIAREIHDVLAHTLSALAVQLEGTRLLVEQRPGDPAAVAAVERAHRLASEGLAEARRAVGALRGDHLPGPDGVQRLVDDFAQATGVAATLTVGGTPQGLSAEAELALYRTAQEALTNVRKHAPTATRVDVRLTYASDGVELVVVDFAPQPVAVNGTGAGYGLVGMRERAELVGGTLNAGASPDGFRVRLWLPKATP